MHANQIANQLKTWQRRQRNSTRSCYLGFARFSRKACRWIPRRGCARGVQAPGAAQNSFDGSFVVASTFRSPSVHQNGSVRECSELTSVSSGVNLSACCRCPFSRDVNIFFWGKGKPFRGTSSKAVVPLYFVRCTYQLTIGSFAWVPLPILLGLFF